MSNTKILNLAEYTSLGLSVLGTMITAATGQAAFAATPLTLALSLNLFNKQELAKRIQHNKNNISHLKQEFSRDINSLSNNINSVRDSLNILPSSKETINLNNLEQEEAIASLSQQLNSLDEQFKNRAKLENLEKIRERLSELEPVTEQLEEFKAQLTQQLNALKLRLDNLPAPSEPINLTEIERAIAIIESQLVTLKPIPEQIAQFQSEFSLLEDLDASAADLHDYTLHLKQELENQKTQLDNQTQQLLIVPQQIEQTIQSFNRLLKETQPAYKYELVFDRDGSRQVLLEALQTAQSRIILVCPWITYYGACNDIIHKCKSFLERGGTIDIGWGHLKDIEQTQHISISRDEFLRIAKNRSSWAYSQLEKFIELEQQYPDKMNLKLLGTHEKFLVCDHTFAMIGSHNFLTSNCHSTEREIGLKTNDKNIIEDLTRRFETAPSLDRLVTSLG